MKGLTPEEYKALLRSVGTHRAERLLSPLEVAHFLKRAVAAGSTRKQCAEALNLGQTQVATFLKLLDLAPDIQHLADWGRSTNASVSFSSLAELAQLSQPKQSEVANAILRYGLTGKEVVQLVQIANRSKKPIAKCIDDIIRLRPQVETRHLFVGAITSESLRQHIESCLQSERDKQFEEALTMILGRRGLVSGRLGSTNFSILSSQALSKLLGLSPDELEQAVNDALERVKSTS